MAEPGDELLPRGATDLLKALVDDFRVVVVNGPRQAGKTTLLKLFLEAHGGVYRSLDDDDQLTVAMEDPKSFVSAEDAPLMIDEVQRGGDRIVLSVKRRVDVDNRGGQFILAGSTRFLTVPTLSESLAGRAAFLDLWQLSMGERTGGGCTSLQTLLREPEALVWQKSPWARDDYLDLVTRGNYPEVIEKRSPASRRRWFGAYVRTIVERDIEDFATVEHADAIPRFLSLLAARAGSTYSAADLAGSLQINHKTVQRYLSFVEMVFLAVRVPVWSSNLTSRLTKAPEVFLTDSGLAASLLRASADSLRAPGARSLGPLVETFVFTELLKLRSLTDDSFEIFHYRDRDKREIDFILELADDRVLAVEVKATLTPSTDHLRQLRWFRDKLGDRLVAGVLLYLGDQVLSFGNGILAAPVSILWDHEPLPG